MRGIDGEETSDEETTGRRGDGVLRADTVVFHSSDKLISGKLSVASLYLCAYLSSQA